MIYFETNAEATQHVIKNFINKNEFNINDLIVFLGNIRMGKKRLNRKMLINDLVEHKFLYFKSFDKATLWKKFNYQFDNIIIKNNIISKFNELEAENIFPIMFVCKNTLQAVYFDTIGNLEVSLKYRTTQFLYSIIKTIDEIETVKLSEIWNQNFSFLIVKKDYKFEKKDLYRFVIKKLINDGILDKDDLLIEIGIIVSLEFDQYLIKKIIDEEIIENDNNR